MMSNPPKPRVYSSVLRRLTDNEIGKPILSIWKEFSLTTSFVMHHPHSEIITQVILRSKRLLLEDGRTE
jgi:hypothetical protein